MNRMKNSQTENSAKTYWLSLSGLFVALMSVYVIADGWWLVIGSAALLASLAVVTAKYGQFSKEARDHGSRFSPTLSWALAAFFAAGFLARGTEVAPYLAPLLGIFGGVVMYTIMKRKNMYYPANVA